MAYTRDPNILTPIMTTDTTPSGTASASSSEGTLVPFRAFTGAITDQWAASGSTGWLRYSWATAQTINYYNIYGQGTLSPTRSPKTWTLEGSNNGADWTVLDTQTNITGWANSVGKTFIFNNSTPYTSYRINVTANNGDAYLSISELELCFNAAYSAKKPIFQAVYVGG